MANNIIFKPINFGEERVKLTKEYIKEHYGFDAKDIKIVPKIIIIHHTAIDSFDESFKRFYPQTLGGMRKDISSASSLNVSAHFLVKPDGTIYQLMPETYMARHVIGLNYYAIGIENVGGQGDKANLTAEQLKANIFLINHLKSRYKTIEYLAGHYEYTCFEGTELFLELDHAYRTKKTDPSRWFMNKLKEQNPDLKRANCK